MSPSLSLSTLFAGKTPPSIFTSSSSVRHVDNTLSQLYVKYPCFLPCTVSRVHSCGAGNALISFVPSTTRVLFQFAEPVGMVVIAAAAPSELRVEIQVFHSEISVSHPPTSFTRVTSEAEQL